jgi:hypothetical protein
MIKRLLSLGAAALAALGAACEEGPATVAGTWRSPATWSSLVYATTAGPLLLELHGEPFGPGLPGFRRSVAEAMSRQTPGRQFSFTTSPEAAPRPGFRVVVAFNPPPDLDPKKLCAGQVATAAASGDRITLLAAFCEGDTMMASVSGWVERATSPDDRRFRQLLGQTVRDLFGPPA